jgi:hypothetical protein
MKQTKILNSKYNNNTIEEHFNNDKLSIWLDSINNKLDFISCLNSIVEDLINCNNNYIYKLEYSLFLHTNDQSKKVIFLLAPDSGIKESNINIPTFLGHTLLWETYKYRGFHVSLSEELNNKNIININDYSNEVYTKLGRIIISINEDVDVDSFIEFKKNCLLTITRILQNSNQVQEVE